MLKRIRARAEKLTGIPGENIIVGAIHSHTACASDVPLYGSPAEKDCAEWVSDKIADAIQVAFHTMVPAKVGYGEEKEDTIAFIRRFYMKDGGVTMNPAFNDPNILEREGSIDPQVGVLRFDALDSGKPLGLIVNYACHCDCVSGTEFSADYPGELSKELKKNLGQDVVCVFLNGCCGNINHIDFTATYIYWKEKDYYKKMGRILAGKVLSAYHRIVLQEDVKVESVSMPLSLPRRQPSEEELAWSEQIATQKEATLKNQVFATALKELYENPIYTNEGVQQVIRIGNTAICALPGEIFVEIGKDIKAASPFAHTMTSELTNGNMGYIASNLAHKNRLNAPSMEIQTHAYETRLSKYTNCAPESHDILVQNAIDMMKQLLEE